MSSGAGSVMDGWSATGAGGAAGVGTDVVLVAVESHISGPGKAGRRLWKWKVSLSRCFRPTFAAFHLDFGN